jgi:hypothetical protein
MHSHNVVVLESFGRAHIRCDKSNGVGMMADVDHPTTKCSDMDRAK